MIYQSVVAGAGSLAQFIVHFGIVNIWGFRHDARRPHL
jgi:hypothetical protein